MRATTHHYAAASLGLAAILISGCSDPTGSLNGAIRAVVTTTGAAIDRDPDGYTLSIDGGPEQVVDIFAAITLADLFPGTHLVELGGLAQNCTVAGSNPQSVDTRFGRGAITVSFVVACLPKLGNILISTATSGTDPDADGYFLNLVGVGGSGIEANGTRQFYGVREGPLAVELSGLSGNCLVDGSNPRTVNVTFGAIIEVAFIVRCESAGRLRVTTVTTGTYIDPSGYELEFRLLGTSSASRTSVSTNGTVILPALLGNYQLTLFEIMPNCSALTTNPRVVTVSGGSETAVTFDLKCDAPRELAFVSVVGANADISMIASNATSVKRITTEPSSDIDPAWSPDGSRIAFTSERDGNREIYVMNADGAFAVRLTNSPAPDFRPAWSPDGAKIAFASTRDGNTEIYVMNADGTNPVRITNNNAYDADPTWSPDGTRIAFSSDREGSGGIWVMNADGSGVTRLTTNVWRDVQPAWSPDGTRIAFSRGSANNSDVYIINADGSGITQLTRGIDNAADPAWSPDGRKIALGSVPGSCGWYDYYCDPFIMVISTDGVPYSSLTTFASNPEWRP